MINKENIISVTWVYDEIETPAIKDCYKVVLNNKETFVPLDEANTDYQAIQEWAAIEGNNIIDPGA